MARYRATVEYDGTAYCGFQRQRGQPSIQQTLEEAITSVSQQQATVTGAGRTDSGVHAAGQVISFEVDWRHGEAALQRALNANLPADIAVLTLTETEPSFNPRYLARRRAYRYTIYNAPARSPLHRQTSWHVNRPLEVARMNEAAYSLVGTQNFATFGLPPKGENTVRQVFRAEWQQRAGTLITFDIEANAFLYRMVRAIVGTLKLVGEGSWTVDEFTAALHACDRSRAGALAPPQGLVLLSVTYDV
jgi:tRNA pseudouridine38-40 synthase